MTTEIVRATPIANNLPDMVRYAEHLADSGLLPRQYQQKPANVLYAMEYGRTLGITPLAAITGVHVIEGKPTASSALISGLVRQAGHKLRVRGDDQRAEAIIIRSDDPDFEFRAVWTLDRAKQAGLANKDVWKKYPAAMLKARAISEVARDACEEVLFGLHYTPEELGAVVDQDGNPVEAPVQQLRVVQAEPQPTVVIDPDSFVAHPQAQELANKAKDAKSKAEIKGRWWPEAATAGVINAGILAPDTGEAEVLGAYLTRVAAKLPESTLKQPPVVVDVEEVDERSTAVDDLRAAAVEAGLADRLETDFVQSYGVGTDAATVEQLREATSLIRGAA